MKNKTNLYHKRTAADLATRMAELKKRMQMSCQEEVEQVDEGTVDKNIARIGDGKDARRLKRVHNSTVKANRKDGISMPKDVRDNALKGIKRSFKEDVEQIDELSKETLKSYIKKTQDGKADLQYAARKGDKKAQHRLMTSAHGVTAAKARLAKEEVEQIEELSKKTLKSYSHKAVLDLSNRSSKQGFDIAAGKSVDKTNHKAKGNRVKGLARSVEKLGEEMKIDELLNRVQEFIGQPEQIDELSKKTLANYANQAANRLDYDAFRRGVDRVRGTMSNAEHKKAVQKATNRISGVQKATSRLAKEEVEQIDELSQEKMKKYITKARKRLMTDNARLNGVITDKQEKRADSILKAQKKTGTGRNHVSEEVEQIDEISKKTLHKYAHAATYNAMNHSHDAARKEIKGPNDGEKSAVHSYRMAFKRQDGIASALKRLAKEEVEQIDELSRELVSRAKEKAESLPSTPMRSAAKGVRVAKKAGTYLRKLDSKKPGVFKNRFTEGTEMIRFKAYLKLQEEAKTVDDNADAEPYKRIRKPHGGAPAEDIIAVGNARKASQVKEEAEQIDELSNGTLNRYVSKATDDAHSTLKKKIEPKGMAKAYRTIVKRAEGIKKAKARFKEDVDHNVEDGTQE